MNNKYQIGITALFVWVSFISGIGLAGGFRNKSVKGSIYHIEDGGKISVSIWAQGERVGSLGKISRGTIRNLHNVDSIVVMQEP